MPALISEEAYLLLKQSLDEVLAQFVTPSQQVLHIQQRGPVLNQYETQVWFQIVDGYPKPEVDGYYGHTEWSCDNPGVLIDDGGFEVGVEVINGNPGSAVLTCKVFDAETEEVVLVTARVYLTLSDTGQGMLVSNGVIVQSDNTLVSLT